MQQGSNASKPSFQLKSIESWVKTVLISQVIDPGSRILDLNCGRGTDIGKWERAKISRYIGLDAVPQNLEQARDRWVQRNRPFSADFKQLDILADWVEDVVEPGVYFDAVVCRESLERSFSSADTARILLANAAVRLKPHGYFFGIIPDSSAIWYKAQKVQSGIPHVRGDGYSIRFESETFEPFGSKYTIRFDDGLFTSGSDCLVHFPTLLRLAHEFGLQWIEATNLLEFYEDHKRKFTPTLLAERIVDRKGKFLFKNTEDLIGNFTTFIFQKVPMPGGPEVEVAKPANGDADTGSGDGDEGMEEDDEEQEEAEEDAEEDESDSGGQAAATASS